MTAEMAAAAAALLGAMIGGAATFAVAYLNLRSERQRLQEVRREQEADIRRKAASAYLLEVDVFLEHCRGLVDAFEKDKPQDHVAAMFEDYEQAWRRIKAAKAPVELSGPSTLALAVRRLDGILGAYAENIDAKFRSARYIRGQDIVPDRQAAETARDKFGDEALQILNVGAAPDRDR